MIPYFDQPRLPIGPITIHAFGVLVAVAMLLGMRIVRGRAVATGLDAHLTDRLVSWVLLGGFAGAHLVDRLVYFPAQTAADPWSLLRFWEGLSSFGGFLGAIIGTLLFVRRVSLAGETLWRYLDAVAYAFPFGWIFGRTGCFVAFDHPGLQTTFFLAQRYRDGLVRHNLGLYEALYFLPLAALFYILGRRSRHPGFFLGWLAILYAPVRFLLDFLRLVDVRYFGLTPGQYGSLALLVVGAVVLWHAGHKKKGEAEASPHSGTV